MEIVLKKAISGQNIKIRSAKIIGVMGDYNTLFQSIKVGILSNITFKTESVYDEIEHYFEGKFTHDTEKLFQDLNIKRSFFDQKINELSSGKIKILKYMILFLQNKQVLFIDEPFQDLDYGMKKKLINLFHELTREKNKTIILGSADSNLIYSLCDDVLFIKKDDYLYGKTEDLFIQKDTLKKYNIINPEIIDFINLVREKGVNLRYSRDIRDLIKDVYKCVKK